MFLYTMLVTIKSLVLSCSKDHAKGHHAIEQGCNSIKGTPGVPSVNFSDFHPLSNGRHVSSGGQPNELRSSDGTGEYCA